MCQLCDDTTVKMQLIVISQAIEEPEGKEPKIWQSIFACKNCPQCGRKIDDLRMLPKTRLQ